MTTTKPMTGEQLDELMAVAVRMQRDGEVAHDFPSANFAYAVQVAVLELRRTRDIAAALAAENAALKEAFNPEEIPEDAVEAFTETAIMDHDWDDTGEWSWVENDTDVIRAVLAAMATPATPATDVYLAEVRASELDGLAGVAETMLVKFSNQQCSTDMHDVVGWKMVHQQASNRAAQLRLGGAA